jgi:transposase InsO family protein
MNQVFRYLDYSKQAFHQKLDRKLEEREHALLLYPILMELREEHPGVAARQLYYILKPAGIGRDKFENLCFEHGLKLSRLKAYHRTTDSSGVIRFPNLIAGREFTSINQAWSSDITYYRIKEMFYYLTFIIDLFSRVIVGFSVSKRLLTSETTLPALTMALKNRQPTKGIIFHTDGGGQYYSKDFLELTHLHGISNSMCDSVYENAHAERINGTIKNQYLKGYDPQNYRELMKMTKRAINNYNLIRPHKTLKNLAPSDYEQRQPAGGTSSTNNDFCNNGIFLEHLQKNHNLSMMGKSASNKLKPIEKTVNVI